MIDQGAVQRSHAVERVAGALAQYTLDKHADRDTSLAARYGPQWRVNWAAEVRGRFQHLAQALAVQRPAILTEHLTWSRFAFAARRVEQGDLSTSVACMREVIAEQLPDAVAAACLECLDDAIGGRGELPPEPATYLDPSAPHYELLLRFLESVLDSRQHDAERVVLEAAGGISVPDLYAHVLQPALAEIGRMWHLDEITVADEHIATAAVERIMSLLHARFGGRPPRGRTVLATSVSGELHSVGVRMVADLFEIDGWTTIYLGANTPEVDILSTLRVKPVDLLAVSATSLLRLRELGELIRAVRGDAQLAALTIIVGGAPFNRLPGLWRELGADGSAGSARAAVEVGNRLVTGS